MNTFKIFSLTLMLSICSIHASYALYDREIRDIFKLVVTGKADQAIQEARQFLKSYPQDGDAHYVLAAAYTHKGDIKKAMQHVQYSIQYGLPFSRYLAGPREIFKPLTESRSFRNFYQENEPFLIHGPLLSKVTENSAEFWVRTYREQPVQVKIKEFEGKQEIQSSLASSKKENDYTAAIRVTGLKPNTEYHYQVLVDGQVSTLSKSFQTYPEKGSPVRLQIGFGGGAGYTKEHWQMWNTLSVNRLNAFLFLGDNVYIDNPEYPVMQDYTYYRQQSLPVFRDFVSHTPIYAIWDDHDFGDDDSWGTPAIDSFPWKRNVWETFRNNWNNPYYGGGEEQPGVWFDFSVGNIDFFMLDCRYYRSHPLADNPKILGETQLNWLFEKLNASDAVFKVLVSSVPWAFNTKEGTRMLKGQEVTRAVDTWQGYQEERERIFSFIETSKIEGILLLSADRHRSDAWKIIRNNGYHLYEFESSKLTNKHTHFIMPEAIFSYNEKCSFGLLDFDTTEPDPKVTYKVVNIDNQVVNQLTLRRSQLDFHYYKYKRK